MYTKQSWKIIKAKKVSLKGVRFNSLYENKGASYNYSF